MNYYKRHIGDYAAKTGHLSALEHGVYNLLIDAYYNREHGPTKAEAMRWARARTAAEIAAVEVVLEEFFFERDGTYLQERIEDELLAFQEKQEANRLIALKRESTKRARNVHQEDHEGSTNRGESVNLANSHKPVANNHKKANTPVVPCGDSSAVIEAYHRILPGCRQIAVLNNKRKKRIAAAVKLAKSVCDSQGWPYVAADFWAAYFTECSRDAWMRGEVPNPKNPAWHQNLDVLLAEDRFAGVMDQAIAAMRGGQ